MVGQLVGHVPAHAQANDLLVEVAAPEHRMAATTNHGEGRVFGLEMIEELRRHGYTLSPGTLYPILHGLQEAGYLRSSQEVVAGKVRRYYQATAKGVRLLANVRKKIQQLVDEVIERP